MKSTKCFILLLTAGVKARMRKDGMGYDEVVEMLTQNIVETIAKGSIFIETPLKLQVRYDGYEAVLAKSKGSNNWIITAYELFENKKSDDGQGVGFDTSKPTHTTPTLARDSMGASDKTNITQVTTDNNEDTRYSEIFDETDKHSVSEVFNSLDSQTITDGWNKHLQEVWDSLFDGNIAVPYG